MEKNKIFSKNKPKKTMVLLSIIMMFLVIIGINTNIKGSSNYPLNVASNFNAFIFNDANISSGSINGRLLVGNEFTSNDGGGSVGRPSDAPSLWIGKSLGNSSSKFNDGRLDNGFILGENSVITASCELINCNAGLDKKQHLDKTIVSSTDFVDNNMASVAHAKIYYQKLSAELANMNDMVASQGEVEINQWNGLILKYKKDSAINDTVYFNINAADFEFASSKKIDFDISNSSLNIVINVAGTNPLLPAWSFLTNANLDKVIINFYEAQNIKQQSGTVRGVILAPDATINLSGSNVSGKIIANNLTGRATLDNYSYTGTLLDLIFKKETKDIETNIKWLNGPEIKPAIKVELLRNNEVVDTKTTNKNIVWENLVINDDDNKVYEYKVRVAEEVSNYSYEISNYDITLSYISKKIDVKGTVEWNDNADAQNLRPDMFVVELYQNKTKVAEQEIGSDKGEYSFENLNQEDQNFEAYEYEVKAKSFENYITKKSGNNFTHYINVADLNSDVEWIGGPANKPKVTIELVRDGEVVATKEAKESFKWKKQLINDAEDKAYEYEIRLAEDVLGYKADVNGLDIKLTYQKKYIDVKGTIEWDDNQNAQELRPDTFVVELYQNGNKIAEQEVNSETNEYSFEKLDQEDQDFKDYEYEVKVKADNNYVTRKNGNRIVRTINVVDLQTKITWIGVPNSKPDLVIELLRGGEVIATKAANASFVWSKQLIRDENNEEYTYTARLVDDSTAGEGAGLKDYRSEMTGLDVTLTYVEKIVDIKGTIEWDDNDDAQNLRPDTFVVELYQNKTKIAEQKIGSDKGEYNFENLNQEDQNFEAYEYEVKAKSFENYITKKSGNDFTHYINVADLNSDVEWIGGPANKPKATIELVRDGEVVATKEAKESFKWKKQLINDAEDKAYEYEIRLAEDVLGYKADVNGLDIKLIYQKKYIDVKGTIEWDDNNDKEKKRPSSFIVELYQNGTKIAEQKISNEATEYSFEKLDQENQNFESYEYSIKVIKFNNYSSEIDSLNIKHTLIKNREVGGKDDDSIKLDDRESRKENLPKTGNDDLAYLLTALITSLGLMSFVQLRRN